MAVAVARARSVSARTFLRIALASCVALFLVITSGAFVRLTGSGLGCENWPSCGDKPYPEQGFHAFVEFGNRMVALVGIVLTLVDAGSRRGGSTGSRGWGRWAALGAFLVAVAQIPMGGITIALDLHPLAVMTHFLLGLAAFGLALVAALEAWSLRDGLARAGRAALAPAARDVGRAAGVHRARRDGRGRDRVGTASGSSDDVERLGLGIVDTVYVHVRVAAVFGIGVLVVGWLLGRLRESVPGARSGSGSGCSSCSSPRRSSARCSTATRCRGGSCSSTSCSRPRSGRSASALAFVALAAARSADPPVGLVDGA